MIVTYFVAIVTYDVQRVKAGRRDCLPFCRAPPPKKDASAWDEPLPQMSNRVMEAWSKFLIHPATKVVVIILSLGFLGAGIYGVTKVDERFDRKILAKDNSYLKRFLAAQEKHFDISIDVSIMLTGNVNYGVNSIQEEIRNLTIVTANPYYRNRSLSWMDAFYQFARKTNAIISDAEFLPSLNMFLSLPDFSYFRQDLKFSTDGKTLEASRVFGFMKNDGSSTFQKNAMLTLRDDIAKLSKLDAFPITRPFIFFEQYAITSRETIRNLLIAALAVLVVTSPFLVDCTVTVLVLLNFAALVCELFGLMVIWDVSLNTVSMITLVMAVGFAVDYSAHIAHAYVASNKATANERVVDALSTLGASVLMGGFSTFLGMIVLAFAASEIFRIFFKMFLGIVGFGLLHGLCIMPVYLSLLCWRPAVIRSPSVRVSVERLNNSNQQEQIGRHNPCYEADDTLSQPCGQCTFKKETNGELSGQKDEETVHNADVIEMGIPNKVVEVDDEEMDVVAIGIENKQQSTSEEAALEHKVKKSGESASSSEVTTTDNEDIPPVPNKTAPDENRQFLLMSEDPGADQNEELPSASVNSSSNGSEDSVHSSDETVVKGSGLNGQVTQF